MTLGKLPNVPELLSLVYKWAVKRIYFLHK